MWPAEHSYLRTRYEGRTCGLIPCAPVAFAQSRHAGRIALSGSVGEYLFVGRDLSNTVTYLGRHGPHGSWNPIDSCPAWRRAITAGHFDYVVTSSPYYLFLPEGDEAWTQTDPAATEVSSTLGNFARVSVFKLHGPMHPGSCPVILPTVTPVIPIMGATRVAVSSIVVAGFDQPMDHASTAGAFSVVRSSDNRAITGSVKFFADRALVFSPSVPLAPATVYTARITTAASNVAGQHLATAKRWSFTTAR
jgi:hypothetical protein